MFRESTNYPFLPHHYYCLFTFEVAKIVTFCIDFLTTKFREIIFTFEDVGEDGTLVDAVHLVLVELAQLLQRFGVIRVDEEQVASKQNVDHIGAAALVPYRKDLYTEGEGKGRRCCLGDSIYSIPCRASYFATGRVGE